MKIGRNQPCPCGSKKKYKRCHGAGTEPQTNEPTQSMLTQAALEFQRRRQQGEGRPIIAIEAFGYRFVAVKGRLLYSKNWKTFPDFLGDYIKEAMGRDWGNRELAKPLEHRHPILQWYNHVCEQQREAKANVGGGDTFTTPMTGAIAAYLHLAYDLFTLEHNAELQKMLIARLRIPDQFEGARYEVFVASALIRAGFGIDFEDESDGNRTHCEFAATFTQTNRKFSVEAKCRSGAKPRLGMRLNQALAKQADHERLVFIEINEPDQATGPDIPEILSTALRMLRRFEGKSLNGSPLPSAYVVVTNTPRHHHLVEKRFRCSVLAEGFQIPDFKVDSEFLSLRDAINARQKHIELFTLLRSMKVHSEVPTTFDGQIPEFAFSEGPPRLLIGHHYQAKDVDGNDCEGILETATVLKTERVAYCVFKLLNGKRVTNTVPLTEAELAAWEKYQETFFGRIEHPVRNAPDALALYDFFFDSYRKTPKEHLLRLLAGSPDIENLMSLDQPALASIYSERCATIAFIKASGPPDSGKAA